LQSPPRWSGTCRSQRGQLVASFSRTFVAAALVSPHHTEPSHYPGLQWTDWGPPRRSRGVRSTSMVSQRALRRPSRAFGNGRDRFCVAGRRQASATSSPCLQNAVKILRGLGPRRHSQSETSPPRSLFAGCGLRRLSDRFSRLPQLLFLCSNFLNLAPALLGPPPHECLGR